MASGVWVVAVLVVLHAVLPATAVQPASAVGDVCTPRQPVELWDPKRAIKQCVFTAGPFIDPSVHKCCCTFTNASVPARCLPHVIVAGAQKSGTTAMFAYMGMHPNFTTSHTKEVHYFDRIKAANATQLAQYLRRLPASTNLSVTGDATPAYVLYPRGLQAIGTVLPHTRIVLILRNPVDRLLSEYNMKARRVESQIDIVRDRNVLLKASELCSETSRAGEPPQKWVACLQGELKLNLPGYGFQLSRRSARSRLSDCLVTYRRHHSTNSDFLALQACFMSPVLTFENVGPLELTVEKELDAARRCTLPQTKALPDMQLLGGQQVEAPRFLWGVSGCWPHGSSSNIVKDFVVRGMYYAQLVELFKVVPQENVLILPDAQLLHNTTATMNRVWEFLSLPQITIQSSTEELHDSIQRQFPGFEGHTGWSVHGSYRPMPALLRKELEMFYDVHNQQLAALLGPEFRFPRTLK